MSQRHKGFTLLEVTITSGLMALLAMMISAAWTSVGRSSTDLIVRGRLFQEMDLAVSALSRDLGGSLADPAARLGNKNQGRWIGWMQPATGQLWLCYDGGSDPDGVADWGFNDMVVVYRVESGWLVRTDRATRTSFTVAGHVKELEILSLGADTVGIQLTLEYRQLTRTCTLIVRVP